MYSHDIELDPGYGRRLATARKALKLTQEEMGGKIGFRNTTIYKWEKETTRPRDTDLTALQQATGIRKAWVASAEEPMLASISEVAGFVGDMITKTIGQPLFDLEEAPRGSFMAPTVEEGDLLLMGSPTPIQEGQVYLVNTSEGRRRVGRIYGHAGEQWALYSDEDLAHPGTCLPIHVKAEDLVGRVTGVVRPLKPRSR